MFQFLVIVFATAMFFLGSATVLRMLSKIIHTQSRILKILKRIEDRLSPVEPVASVIEFYEIKDGQLMRVHTMVQSIDEVKKYKIIARDKAGNEAKLDGIPSFNFTDAGLADLVVDEAGIFEVTPKLVGICDLQVVADADLGEGVIELIGTASFEFTAGQAVSLEVVPV